MSIGEYVFSDDKRLSVNISIIPRDFNLTIRDVQLSDAGVYECAVTARDKIIRHVHLRVTGTNCK